jgi:putative ABC transport system substrate-binding protein
MNRRHFITLLGGVAAWPSGVRGQQATMPVVGFLNPASFEGSADRVRGFRQGLKETGFVESENVMVDYRWADNELVDCPR